MGLMKRSEAVDKHLEICEELLALALEENRILAFIDMILEKSQCRERPAIY